MDGAAASGQAPGRVNLLGEHTDYNDGFVLPIAINRFTRVAVSPSAGFEVRSANLKEQATFTLEAPPAQRFALYVYGCVKELSSRGIDIPPLSFSVESDVPMGVGLSSSAALEVATLRALRAYLRIALDDVELARMAQRAEVEHAGVHCGIMDQMACSLAEPRRALFLDTRTLDRRLVPLPEGSEVVVVDSGITRSLAATAYNQRRSECEQAARTLGVPALRDVGDPGALERLPETLQKRARHVVTENARVLAALEARSGEAFGALMRASHSSLRDDFEVSTPGLDRLVSALNETPEIHGARLTGAGFGGACVALCRAPNGASAAANAVERYNASGGSASVMS